MPLPTSPLLSRVTVATVLAAALAACALPRSRSTLAAWTPSPNVDGRRAQLVVLHHTQTATFDEALRMLRTRNPSGRVSAHYLVGRDGRTVQLVDENARAWHAGAGRWGAITEVNSASIGIELENDGAAPFPDVQVDALLRLLDDVTARQRIRREQIVAHGDIAPTRKQDPHAGFPWARLAAAGYGLWPREPLQAPPAGFDPWTALALVGYDVRDPAAALRAFHRRFRGHDRDGWEVGDAEVLYDLQRQRLALPTPPLLPVPSVPSVRDPAPPVVPTLTQ